MPEQRAPQPGTPGADRPCLVVAGLSARLMAESAAADGFAVQALDLFGDADTRAAAVSWRRIGEAASLAIDAAELLRALHDAAAAQAGQAAIGWVAGPGLEGQPALLAEGAGLLPLLGTPPAQVARLRDPAVFFNTLDALGLPHPEVALAPRPDAKGWLVKHSAGSGGWHIAQAQGQQPLAAGQYLQHAEAGQPMSATFVANGQAAVLLGINQQRVRPMAGRPHVFCGVVGPVPVPHALTAQLNDCLQRLTAAFGLVGLGSLDFLRDGERLWLLEVNPRPPASMALYRHWRPMAAHVQACLNGRLPEPPPRQAPEQAVQGHEIVFARKPLRLRDGLARRLAQWPGLHDRPSAGQRFDAGEPVCSLAQAGANAEQVLVRLDHGRKRLLNTLEKAR